jgi:hypothetical protein
MKKSTYNNTIFLIFLINRALINRKLSFVIMLKKDMNYLSEDGIGQKFKKIIFVHYLLQIRPMARFFLDMVG